MAKMAVSEKRDVNLRTGRRDDARTGAKKWVLRVSQSLAAKISRACSAPNHFFLPVQNFVAEVHSVALEEPSPPIVSYFR